MKTTTAGSTDPATTTNVSVPRQYDGEQLDLISLLAGPASLAERFAAFHADNPGVYDLLVKLTREFLRRTGKRRLGINAVIERARWEYALQTTETPSINNSYAPFYSRLMMATEPDLVDVFETRRSTADGGYSGQSRDSSRDVTRDGTRD